MPKASAKKVSPNRIPLPPRNRADRLGGNESSGYGAPIRTIELFAGVGGFHVGMKQANKALGREAFRVVWSNQWEPGAKKQWASEIYRKRFPDAVHANEDIEKVIAEDRASVPDFDLLVGGFPCQDYSVAKTLNQAKGIEGKKGVLWWSIYRMIETAKKKPALVVLENVDRLLKSPAKQRGRDFAIILACLNDLGYAVEWRVINAADYGMPQKRRRVFILGYHKSTRRYRAMEAAEPSAFIRDDGTLAHAFPCKEKEPYFFAFETALTGSIPEISEKFNAAVSGAASPFENAGICVNRKFTSIKVVAESPKAATHLKHILLPESKVPDEYFIDEDSLDQWRYLKGGKKEKRKSKATGHEYDYAEGPLPFPDPLDRPGRTIITSEGGSSPSRFKHVVQTKSGRYRRLTPVELERMNMFPDDHTKEAPDKIRAFLMGNALVCGIPERIFVELSRDGFGV